MQYNRKDVANLRGKLVAEVNEAVANPSVEVFATLMGVGIRLHNENGLRPTMYHAEFRMNNYGFLNTVVLDTIIWENKSHSILKQSFPTIGGKGDEWYALILKKLTGLASQECSGSKEETYQRFTSIGLLMMKKEAIEQETA